MNVEKVGAYLASLRKGRDMTQQQVADILGVSNKTVSKWESGAGLPDIAALPALAALYGVTADDILAGETRPRACGDAPSEVGLYLERRSGLRFRIGYSVAVMLLAAWAAFQYTTWSWLFLLASPICLWLGWSTCRSKDILRRRILLCSPLCALWVFAWIQRLNLWYTLASAYVERGGLLENKTWVVLAMRRQAVWLLLPLLLAVILAVAGAVMKEPLVRDKNLRFAVYGGCGLMVLVEVVYLAVCWQPALLYARTKITQFGGEATLAARYQELSTVAEPMATVRWIALGLVLAVCVYYASRARKREKEN